MTFCFKIKGLTPTSVYNVQCMYIIYVCIYLYIYDVCLLTPKYNTTLIKMYSETSQQRLHMGPLYSGLNSEAVFLSACLIH